MLALTNLALVIKYLPQVISLFTTIKAIHDSLPATSTLQDKLTAVESAITAAHAIAVVDGATTVTFDEFYTPIKGVVELIVANLHG